LGALTAIADLRGRRNVLHEAAQMMRSLTARGNESFGVGTPNEVFVCDSLPQLSDQGIDSSVAVGFNLNKILAKDVPQPVASGGLRLVFEGRVLPTSEISDCERALSWLEEKQGLRLQDFVKGVDGSYAMAMLHEKRLLVARDLLGCKPLYWGEANGIVAFASERKALWVLGIESPQRFPPGGVGSVGEGLVSVQGYDARKAPVERKINLDSAARRLSELIIESIRKRAGDLKRVAVAYSGGLDSGVLASCSRAAGLDVKLFTVTAKSNDELEHAKKTSEELGLPLAARRYSLADVRAAILQVLQRIEKPNAMDVAIAIPVLWTCQLAEGEGFQAIFVGQGADELFGGYDRYIRAYQRKGPEEAGRMMMTDVLSLSELGLERDEQVSAGTKVELRLPFVDKELIDFGLSLPLSLKIAGIEDPNQKLVLRRVAQLQGIPSSISERPKRAMQYTTGVNAAIGLLARGTGLTPGEYILEHYGHPRKSFGDNSKTTRPPQH